MRGQKRDEESGEKVRSTPPPLEGGVAEGECEKWAEGMHAFKQERQRKEWAVAQAVGNNLVVYGVLQIRRTRKIYIGKNHTLKMCTTRTTMNGGGGGYCNRAKLPKALNVIGDKQWAHRP